MVLRLGQYKTCRPAGRNQPGKLRKLLLSAKMSVWVNKDGKQRIVGEIFEVTIH